MGQTRGKGEVAVFIAKHWDRRSSEALIEFATPTYDAQLKWWGPKGQFPVTGIFRAGGILDNKWLLSRNYLFKFRATFSPANNRISARSENYTNWRSALTGHRAPPPDCFDCKVRGLHHCATTPSGVGALRARCTQNI